MRGQSLWCLYLRCVLIAGFLVGPRTLGNTVDDSPALLRSVEAEEVDTSPSCPVGQPCSSSSSSSKLPSIDAAPYTASQLNLEAVSASQGSTSVLHSVSLPTHPTAGAASDSSIPPASQSPAGTCGSDSTRCPADSSADLPNPSTPQFAHSLAVGPALLLEALPVAQPSLTTIPHTASLGPATLPAAERPKRSPLLIPSPDEFGKDQATSLSI
ncbi:hypothetical protein V8C86DRAFT_2527705, partial [Haematococcus lacustris]